MNTNLQLHCSPYPVCQHHEQEHGALLPCTHHDLYATASMLVKQPTLRCWMLLTSRSPCSRRDTPAVVPAPLRLLVTTSTAYAFMASCGSVRLTESVRTIWPSPTSRASHWLHGK